MVFVVTLLPSPLHEEQGDEVPRRIYNIAGRGGGVAFSTRRRMLGVCAVEVIFGPGFAPWREGWSG